VDGCVIVSDMTGSKRDRFVFVGLVGPCLLFRHSISLLALATATDQGTFATSW